MELTKKPKETKPVKQKKNIQENNKIKPKENKRKYTKKPKDNREKSFIENFNDKLKKEEETMRTKKIRIFPDAEQKKLFKKWIGTYRFIYNFTKDLIVKEHNTRNFMILRDNIVTESGNTLMNDKKWSFETPKEIRSNSIRELLTSLKKGGHVKYKSKKENIQTIKLPKQAYKRNPNGISMYPTLSGNIRTKCSIKENEYIPETSDCDIRLTYRKPNIWHILIPVKEKIMDIEKKPHKIGAVDLNLRNLMTGVGTDGGTFKIGDNCYDKIKEHSLLIDKLRSKLTKLKKERKRLEYLKTKNIMSLQEFKIQNLVDELHNKTIKYLTDNYDIILYPPLRIQELVNKNNNKNFNRKAYSLRHYKLLCKLESKCKILGKKLVRVKEHYTTKTCSVCGEINLKMGKEEIFKCPKCCKIIDRDINSARNILSKSLIGSLY
jgi:putative transposase